MKWVTIWGNAQSTVLPQPAIYAKNLTLRYPIFIPFNGNKVRITLDNFCCNEKVEIESVYLSMGKSLSDEQMSQSIPLTVNGKSQFKIESHSSIVSDSLDFEAIEGMYLIISMYIKNCTNLTSGVDIIGPLSKGYFAYGNQALSSRLDINTSKSTSWVYFLANIDIFTEEDKEAIICYGDSITSQDWPDYLLLALREKGFKNLSVVRKAVSGTRILREYNCITYQSYGKHGYHRFIHEVSSVSGAKKIIIQHGINDIIHPVGVEVNPFRPMTDLPTAAELIEGLKYYGVEAGKLGLEVYYGSLLPIYGWRTYAPFREKLKNEVNTWIRKQSHIDFENAIGKLQDDAFHFKENCDSGDHLHPSKYAYKQMGVLAFQVLMNHKK
ncbi:MAG: lipase [Roseburia sp.]|nr:hypothetical protein [Anaeroplasma bactoclasticum]MCM1196338.1 lipase [Roseburia sp.]MCM1556485.1 hypothetical protein [Anaeroplasma bactoclasticum]